MQNKSREWKQIMHLLATQRKLKFALLSNFVSSVMKLTQMTILARKPKWTIKTISVVTEWIDGLNNYITLNYILGDMSLYSMCYCRARSNFTS